MVGGRLQLCYNKWRSLTSDPFILNAVRGYKLEFDPEKLPLIREKGLYDLTRNPELTRRIDVEISTLLSKNVIEHCDHEIG